MATSRRVLLSAFACSPSYGSESGVGWNWALETANLGHDVTVITRREFQPAIEAANLAIAKEGRLNFVYVDWVRRLSWEGAGKALTYGYVYLWQWLAWRTAQQLHRQMPFDLVHHITFGAVRFPSFMGGLGIPFVFGPAGGGESAPSALRRGFPLRGKLVDALRDLLNRLVAFDPLVLATLRRARLILIRTQGDLAVVPRRFHPKVFRVSEVGIRCPQPKPVHVRAPGSVRFLYAGRLLYLKGMHLGIPAFATALQQLPGATLTIAGRGPEEGQWRELAERSSAAGSIRFLGAVPFEEIGQLYREHDILLFPSLRDSGANVVYEAAAHALPVVCLKLGGPGELVEDDWGKAVEVKNLSEGGAIAALAEAMVEIATDRVRLETRSLNARAWAERQTWTSRVSAVYERLDGGGVAPSTGTAGESAEAANGTGLSISAGRLITRDGRMD